MYLPCVKFCSKSWGRGWLEEMGICIACAQLFNCICGKSWGGDGWKKWGFALHLPNYSTAFVANHGGGGGWKKWGFAFTVLRLHYHNIDRLVYQSACSKI